MWQFVTRGCIITSNSEQEWASEHYETRKDKVTWNSKNHLQSALLKRDRVNFWSFKMLSYSSNFRTVSLRFVSIVLLRITDVKKGPWPLPTPLPLSWYFLRYYDQIRRNCLTIKTSLDNHSTHIMTDVRHHGFKGVVITESVGFVDENSSVNDTKN